MKSKTSRNTPASSNGNHGSNGKNGGNGSHGGPAASMAGKGGKPKTGPLPPVLAKLVEEQPLSASVPTGHYDSGAQYGQIAYADDDPLPPVNDGGKVKMGLAEKNNLQLGAYAQNYVENTTGNPHFPAPQPPLADVTAGVNAFMAKVNEVLALETTLRTAVALRDTLRTNVETLLKASAAYVQQASNGNKDIILSSGLGVRNPPTPVTILAAPTNLRVALDSEAGQMRIRWDKVTHAMTYELQCSLDVTPRVWETIQASSRTTSLKNLEVGHTYVFRVCAVGSPGRSNWSPEVKRGAA